MSTQRVGQRCQAVWGALDGLRVDALVLRSPVMGCVGPRPRKAKYRGGYSRRRGCFGAPFCRRAKTGEASFAAAAPHSESCHNQRIAACGPTCVRMHLPYRHTDPATGVPGRICIPRFCLAAWAWLSILSVARPTSCGEGPAWRHINGSPTHDQSAAHPFRMRASLMPLPSCLKASRRMHQIRECQRAGEDR